MDTNTKKFLSSILEDLRKIDYVKPEEIPNIDLYMDQITTFMDSQLAASKRYADDKILTKTMINNYAKNNLLPPPAKKKYTKEHVLTLIFIYYFKNILSISDIQSILNPITERISGKTPTTGWRIFTGRFSGWSTRKRRTSSKTSPKSSTPRCRRFRTPMRRMPSFYVPSALSVC